jgi:hypothetical protein
MAVLTVQNITGAGLATSYAAASTGGDSFPSDTGERTFLHVKNAGVSPITVTIPPATTTEKLSGVGSFTVPSLGGTVPASGDAMFGPFPRDYVDGLGHVNFTYSSATSVTVAAFSLHKAD